MKVVLLLVVFISSSSFAFENQNLSAYRNLKIDYEVYVKKVHDETDEKLLGSSAIRSARLYKETELTTPVIGWKSKAEMQKRFEAIRDARFLTLASDPDFPRRISWLYPKDGCWTRAALFNRNAFRLFIPIPNKVFAFGNLRVKTPNSARGVVGWWYHVAPIVQVGETKFVMDPSIEPERPLTLDEWLFKMGNPKKIKIAICGSGTYSPGDRCDKETDGMELRAEQTQKQYLALEERELRRMGRNPDTELGENPPWKSN